MSHYSVLVITGKDQSAEELLAPFDENLTSEEPIGVCTEKVKDWEGNTVYINPDAKWDWYSLCGRFDALHRRGDAERDYSAVLVSELDTSPDREKYLEALRFWEESVDGDGWRMFSKEYYTDRYKDKYEYADACAAFSTYAVLTPDGEWHEPGEMGWFGCSNSTPDSEKEYYSDYIDKFIKPYADPKDGYTATLVDCHI